MRAALGSDSASSFDRDFYRYVSWSKAGAAAAAGTAARRGWNFLLQWNTVRSTLRYFAKITIVQGRCPRFQKTPLWRLEYTVSSGYPSVLRPKIKIVPTKVDSIHAKDQNKGVHLNP